MTTENVNTINFSDFELPDFLISRLKEIGFNAPTEIQSKVIPLVLNSKNILASSKTGSGKTGAFAIPILAKVMNSSNAALILVPTRELAIQIKDAIHNIRGEERINTALIFGGSDIRRQMDTLRRNPNIIIATPGRLNDHILRKTIDLSKFNVLVLDEFDRMLEMGFKNEINTIIAKIPKERQTLMFSATTRKSIKDIASTYMQNYEEVILANTVDDHKNITQEFLQIPHSSKYTTLIDNIAKKEGTVIIFVGTKRMADQLCQSLQDDGHSADSIHGDLRQREREKAIKDFRTGKYRILVATDVVARGLDVPHVKIIINYDMPKNPEDYTHRIGRTGRADETGLSISFITPIDRKIHQAIIMKSNSDEFEGDSYKKGGNFGRRTSSGNRSGGGYGRGSGGSENRDGYKKSYNQGGNREGGNNYNRSSNNDGNSDGGYRGGDRNDNRGNKEGGYRNDDRKKPYRKFND